MSMLENNFLKKNKDKAIKIYEGYSYSWYKNTKIFDYNSLGIPKNAIVVCSVGNHRKVKGTKYFLESSYFLNSKKNIHYVLIGNKTDSKEFIKIAKDSPISDKIHFMGIRKDAVSLIKGSDIYVQASLSEGFGRAFSEAMSVEKPIVMTNAGGCTELIDENSGIITPLRDPKSIGNAISKFANDEILRNRTGLKAKERIDTILNFKITVDETYKLYENLIK